MLTRTLALEVASDGILVNAGLPGGVMTDGRPTGGLGGPAAEPGRFLLGVAHPSKHAAALLFLAGPGASHMTGETLVVDGGFLIS
jgi:NAD(P)-dependent dehydrogenase (short-subunit alcohol dehydrogenase family)